MAFLKLNEIINPSQTINYNELLDYREELKPCLVNTDLIAAFDPGVPDAYHCTLYLEGIESPVTVLDLLEGGGQRFFHTYLEPARFIRVYFKRRIVFSDPSNQGYETYLRSWWRVDPKFIVALTEEKAEDGEPRTAVLLSGVKERLLSVDTLDQIRRRIEALPSHQGDEEEFKQLHQEDIRQYKGHQYIQ